MFTVLQKNPGAGTGQHPGTAQPMCSVCGERRFGEGGNLSETGSPVGTLRGLCT